ncbi:MAG: PilW family protein [Candidatus Calescibacterium sp.]|nr:PilW family protein [Candidatus Calescibacterium sp.]
MKNKKGMSLLEIPIYSVLLTLVTTFLYGIMVFYQKTSRTLDTIANFQSSLQTVINILDYNFTNAGYVASQEGAALSALYFVNENGQVVDRNTATQINRIQLVNNKDRDLIHFYFFELEENRLGYIRSARNLGGGNSSEIDILDNSLSNNIDTNGNGIPDIREIWPDPNDNSNGTYPVIMYCQDNSGKWIGVLFYITRVQYNANHMQHRPLALYGGNLNQDIVDRLPQTNNVRLMKPRNIYRTIIGVNNNNELFIENYNFRTDIPFNTRILLSNVESFNIRVGLDSNGDNLVDTNSSGNINWQNTIPQNMQDKVAVIEYTIVVRSHIRNLIGLDRNPLTGIGGDRFKRYLLRRTVTLKNIVNPEI